MNEHGPGERRCCAMHVARSLGSVIIQQVTTSAMMFFLMLFPRGGGGEVEGGD